ncbi:hypothetical protein I35_0627 [Burkholderia cenocepacia H111]|nr:hypothetical protein I35_0627 [Burkholderia cenocepacia H111]
MRPTNVSTQISGDLPVIHPISRLPRTTERTLNSQSAADVK